MISSVTEIAHAKQRVSFFKVKKNLGGYLCFVLLVSGGPWAFQSQIDFAPKRASLSTHTHQQNAHTQKKVTCA